MNNKEQQNIQSEKTLTEIFKYNAEAGASEYHVMIHSTKPEDTYEEQLKESISYLSPLSDCDLLLRQTRR